MLWIVVLPCLKSKKFSLIFDSVIPGKHARLQQSRSNNTFTNLGELYQIREAFIDKNVRQNKSNLSINSPTSKHYLIKHDSIVSIYAQKSASITSQK